MVHAELADETLRTQSVQFHYFNFAYFAPNFCALCVNLTFWTFPFYKEFYYEQRCFKIVA